MSQTMDVDFVDEIDGLETAEDFLNFFDVEYDAALVVRKRIQLLRLFQQILDRCDGSQSYGAYKHALCVAYKQLELGRELAFANLGCDGCTSCDDEEQ
jgi:nitrogenase-stabilizing/protective protein